MFEIDFRPVDCELTAGSVKSGDAIAIRFTSATDGLPKVVIIDGGFQANGTPDGRPRSVATTAANQGRPDDLHSSRRRPYQRLALHRRRTRRQGADRSTSRDKHAGRSCPSGSATSRLSTPLLCRSPCVNGTSISDPFTGTERFEGQLVLLGPDKDSL